jgi:hypothetical protein
MSQAFTAGFIIKDGQRVIDSSVGALTVQGDVNIGANQINTTNLSISEASSDFIKIRDKADTTPKGIVANIFNVSPAGDIRSDFTDDGYAIILAKNTGVGYAEVARIQGAAAPALCVGNSGASANDDFASIADQVKLGNYEIAAGRRTLALATEEAVAVEAALASTHTLSVRINGATFRILLTNA